MVLTYSLVNHRMNEIFQKTLTNGAEATFNVVGLYYFTKLGSKFDRNMILMTVAITVCFLVRSSSLVGWVPLALYFATRSLDNFMNIALAGVFIAVPITLFSVGLDSLFYGCLTCPQLNFVHINVVENLSRFFGIDPVNYYLVELPEFLTSAKFFFPLHIFGLCLFTSY